MFQPNEYVVYGRSGVCRVEGIEQRGGQDYYSLWSICQNCRIETPVNGKNPIRAVISKDEANALIDQIPSIQAKPLTGSNLRELGDQYRNSILSQECLRLLELTMSIYAKKKASQEAGKKLGNTDSAFLKEGEQLLFGELSIALEIPFDEVQPYIKRRVEQECNKASQAS